MAEKWSERNADRTARYFVITGRAYPDVLQGNNPTKIITSNPRVREEFYHDKAVMLSDANMDQFNGAEKIPIWEEHGAGGKHEVGYVHHSWMERDADGRRGLKIVARIPLGPDHPHGERVKQMIQSGRYKGFSVGYSTDMLQCAQTGQRMVDSKSFREISLCEEPFFDNCQLSWGVAASKSKATEKHSYKSPSQFYARISKDMEAAQGEQQQQQKDADAQQQQQQNAVAPEELLKQVDRLKEQENQRKEENERLREENARFRAWQQQQVEEYAKAQLPKYEEFVKVLKEQEGEDFFSEQQLVQYKNAFCDPAFKEDCALLEKQHLSRVETAASKKKMAEELEQLRKDNEQLKQVVNKTTQVMNHSRSEIANVLSGDKDVDKMAADASTRKRGTIEASRELTLKGMMVAESPSVAELGFLKKHGFSAAPEGEVNASQCADGEWRPLPTTFKPAPLHRNSFDQYGDKQFPLSWRENNKQIFSWMCGNDGLRNGDLSHLVSFNTKFDLKETKYNE